jgi:hypothetical protein
MTSSKQRVYPLLALDKIDGHSALVGRRTALDSGQVDGRDPPNLDATAVSRIPQRRHRHS